MKRTLPLPAAAVSLLAAAHPAGAVQDVAAEARVGTMGIGVGVTVPVYERFAVRAGAGILGFDLDLTGRFGVDDDRTAKVTLPKALFTLGADVRLRSLRLGAGVLLKSGQPAYRVTLDPGANIVIGSGTYEETEVKTLTTTLSSGAAAPYFLLGFGSHSSSGFSFAADVGVALPTGVNFILTAAGDEAVISSESFHVDLAQETKETDADAGGIVNYWPIVSVGVRYGFRLGGPRE